MLKQAKDYDPHGEYVRLWCPELKDVPDEHVHHPWTWEGNVRDYPEKPIIMRPEWGRQQNRSAGEGQKTRGNKSERVGGRGRGRGRGGAKA
jgi:deoxyribodipyrimidine photo-lyase